MLIQILSFKIPNLELHLQSYSELILQIQDTLIYSPLSLSFLFVCLFFH